MSSELRDLYQEMILDHNRNPRNFRKLEKPTAEAEGYNPLCGDRYTVYVNLDGDVITDVGFQGAGCAISKASASVMSQMVKGKKTEEAESLFQHFRNLVTGDKKEALSVGKLAAFSGVSEFPTRVKCAVLAWHTLSSALHGAREVVTTEEGTGY
jgi:nitrogen fixation NifU-like protein